jgi:hypothetical protein
MDKNNLNKVPEKIEGIFYGTLFEVTYNDFDTFILFTKKGKNAYEEIKKECLKRENIDSTYEIEYVHVYKVKEGKKVFNNKGPFGGYEFPEEVMFSEKYSFSIKTPNNAIPEKEILLNKFNEIKDFVFDSNGNLYYENIEQMIDLLQKIKDQK